jgi:glycosyltransferase involved in cell wall biosynthesis
MTVAPIALFAYNRVEHLRRTLEALKNCDLAKESKLYIFSDGPKTSQDEYAVAKVRDMVKGADGFAHVRVVARQRNLGLAASIIDGVSELCRAYGQAIVLEDDLVVARSFLRFMNEALRLYRDEKAVMQVSGYVLPMAGITRLGDTFMCRVASSWGWATWDRAWSCFNPDSQRLLAQLRPAARRRRFDVENSYPYYEMLKKHATGKMDVWGVRWYASMFLEGGLCVYPTESLVQNIGMDASTRFDVDLSGKGRWKFVKVAEESSEALRMISQFFRTMTGRKGNAIATLSARCIRRVVRMWDAFVEQVRRVISGRREVL